MKEFVDIHDYIISQAVVGDWDGMEEQVAENINEFYHTLYFLAEEDIAPAVLEALLELVWEHWIGNPELADIDPDDIHDWCRHVLENRDQFLEN
jgi:hypothetical protein